MASNFWLFTQPEATVSKVANIVSLQRKKNSVTQLTSHFRAYPGPNMFFFYQKPWHIQILTYQLLSLQKTLLNCRNCELKMCLSFCKCFNLFVKSHDWWRMPFTLIAKWTMRIIENRSAQQILPQIKATELKTQFWITLHILDLKIWTIFPYDTIAPHKRQSLANGMFCGPPMWSIPPHPPISCDSVAPLTADTCKHFCCKSDNCHISCTFLKPQSYLQSQDPATLSNPPGSILVPISTQAKFFHKPLPLGELVELEGSPRAAGEGIPTKEILQIAKF